MDRTLIAKGDPSKALFIYMLTRDISLADCIVDLIDNCVDGIRSQYSREGRKIPPTHAYKGFKVEISFDKNKFSIKDNCGGIPIDIAAKYALCFGRRDDEARSLSESGSIGLYGIGMKRSIFKMGQKVDLISSTGTESFCLPLDVDDWASQSEPTDSKKDVWDFTLHHVIRKGTTVPCGTSITITGLHPQISLEFAIPGFENQLIYSLRRQYAFIVQQGLSLKINGKIVSPIMPTFRVSEDLAPMRIENKLGLVTWEVIAGLSSPPPEDDSAESSYAEAEIYGWYVICNDRVVVTADKTSLTTWGVTPVPSWHNQYNGFLGLMRFTSPDPRGLPWTTTKRSVDASSPVYKEALLSALTAAKQFTDYTNRRKGDFTRLKKLETAASVKQYDSIPIQPMMKLPAPSKRRTMRIQYDKPTALIESVARSLKLPRTSAREVGIRTFDYYVEREIGE